MRVGGRIYKGRASASAGGSEELGGGRGGRGGQGGRGGRLRRLRWSKQEESPLQGPRGSGRQAEARPPVRGPRCAAAARGMYRRPRQGVDGARSPAAEGGTPRAGNLSPGPGRKLKGRRGNGDGEAASPQEGAAGPRTPFRIVSQTESVGRVARARTSRERE